MISDVQKLLNSFLWINGKLSRSQFFHRVVLWACLLAMMITTFLFLFEISIERVRENTWLVVTLMTWSCATVCIKRLHDLGKSGLWFLAWAVLTLFLWFLAKKLGVDVLPIAIRFPYWAGTLWCLAYLLFAEGYGGEDTDDKSIEQSLVEN